MDEDVAERAIRKYIEAHHTEFVGIFEAVSRHTVLRQCLAKIEEIKETILRLVNTQLREYARDEVARILHERLDIIQHYSLEDIERLIEINAKAAFEQAIDDNIDRALRIAIQDALDTRFDEVTRVFAQAWAKRE